MNAELKSTISAPLSHPCYEGHFPGRPVLPGVLLLELIVEALGRGAPHAITTMKFQRALTPGESCALEWTAQGARVSFRCTRAGEPVAEGVLDFGSGV